MIEIKKIDDNSFEVTVTKGKGTTRHFVAMDDEYYEDLTGGEISREELVRRSFEFVLDREPKEAILAEFNLRTIKKYFPSYEDEIRI